MNLRSSWNFSSSIKKWFNRLRVKIAQFDIKPEVSVIPDLLQQARDAQRDDDYALAFELGKKILRLNNTNRDALLMVGDIYMRAGRFAEAAHNAKHALRYYPDDISFYEMLGVSYAMQNKLVASAEAYEKALKLDPEATDLEHLLACVKQEHGAMPSDQYITKLFNAYADDFEKSLVDHLEYKTHIKLAKFVHTNTRLKQPVDIVVDLGCGTGLLGVEISRYFQIQKMVGVDLADKMLAQSSAKGVYQELHQKDVLQFMRDCTQPIDMLVSSDVFPYCGNIEPWLTASWQCLLPGGYLAFSVERARWGNYVIQPNGRYKHSLKYLRSLYKKCGFSKMYSQAIDLRKECGKMVAGYLVLLQK